MKPSARSAIFVGAVIALLTVVAIASAAQYRYAGAWRSTAATNSTVSITLTSATVTDENNNHILASLDIGNGSQWLQGGVARGDICGNDPRPGGVWIYVEINTGSYPCNPFLGYTLIYVKSGALNSLYRIQIQKCLNAGGCGCFSAAMRTPRAAIATGVVKSAPANRANLDGIECSVWDSGTWAIYVDGVRVAFDVSLPTSLSEAGLLEDGAAYTANDSGSVQYRNFTTTMTYLCDQSHQTLFGCAGSASWITNTSNWNASLPSS
jgi:hypothetical protein